MMDRLIEKAGAIAAKRAGQVVGKVVAAARAELPDDVTVRAERERIVIEGKALARRALTDLALRGLVALARAVLK